MIAIESTKHYTDHIRSWLNNTLTETALPVGTKRMGKVRDQYDLGDTVALITTDRQSAFDRVLASIPFKGQVLNQIASQFLKATTDIAPNWLEATPDPSVSIGKRCEPFKVEMVIRGYLTGHAWREYRDGKRTICGVPMPNGMKENDKFPMPILTPTTKAEVGHDEDISREEILAQGLVSEQDYLQLEDYTKALFARGTEMAAQRGLILVDTKYEFGKDSEGVITLIDEIHTPDSSRYFFKEGYRKSQDRGEKQKQLSKEFVRQWLIENGFQGKDGQEIPFMSDEFVASVSERYIELFEHITGEEFVKQEVDDVLARVENNILNYLQ